MGTGVLVRIVLDQLHRGGCALDQGTRRDHLADIERRRAADSLGTGLTGLTKTRDSGLTQTRIAILPAQPSEGPVGDAGHRGEHHRGAEGVAADLERREYGGHGPPILAQQPSRRFAR